MNLVRWIRARGLCAAALLGLSAGGSIAADATPAPTPAAPALGAPCENCAASQPQGCETCDKGCRTPLFGGLHTHKVKVPYLCPGACFGYFQTKWNRWEDVCSHYYQGVNVSDAPKPVVPEAKRPPMPKPLGTGPMPTPMPPPKPEASPLPSPTPAPSPTPIPPVPMPKGVDSKFSP